MSAIVCGKRSSIFEDLSTTSPPVSKRIRCSSSSPVRFSPPATASGSSNIPSPQLILVDQLRAIYPDMDKQLLERALEECGNDLNSAIRSLNELRLGSVDKSLDSNGSRSDVPVEPDAQLQSEGEVTCNADTGAPGDPIAGQNYPMDGAEWVELFVKEMMSASNMDDAKTRASRVLEALEKSICARASADTARNFHREYTLLKENAEALIQENLILKRAVSIRHERLKEYEDRNQELQHLKQLVSQYQEQLKTLEVNNYALAMHLKQAQQGNSISGHFHPDVF
ncbi:hypothetical protein L6164_011429 [Bauhinia variegata]|uniref:Uncharacterized protein n=1 Tax=Bauhinia variegata TaxID=167791 RepID=A0ACB9P8H1_BAUVA|nr:hypothetical protein L6164_011429 [Bauhinia variegata]